MSFRNSETFNYRGIGILVLLLLLTAFPHCAKLSASEPAKFAYPPAKMDNVIDNYHGVMVADPYRWLEDPDSKGTKEWVERENTLSSGFFEANPDRKEIEERLTRLLNYPKYSVPWKAGSRYFFYKNEGLQNQPVLYMQKSLKDKPELVIDPNKFSDDGTVSLRSAELSHDGNLLAYGISVSGSDEEEFKIRDVDKGCDYPEALQHCRFTSIAWKHDNSGFFYNRYPDPGMVSKADGTRFNRVCWHRLNTPQSEDRLIYEDPKFPDHMFSPFITDDGKYLVLSMKKGTEPRNRIYYRKIGEEGDFSRLIDESDAFYHFIDNIGSIFYFRTDLNAPRGRIIAIDLDNPGRDDWKEIIPEQIDALSSVIMADNQFVTVYSHNACAVMKLSDKEGLFTRDIELPGLGSIASLWGKRDEHELFFSYTSFIVPSDIYRYDFNNGELSLFHRSEMKFDASDYETEQIFYRSKDGTRVPLFITHRKGLKCDGNNPVLLYGYGGFSISLTPWFSSYMLIWLEQGGVYAVANLRGGDEYGEEWHRAGILKNKQNVFDDFIAAGEWLISNKYTKASRLAINGGSNGGLLVAACLVQRPELFGAVVCEVPLTDMLRYHRFTVGHFWESEYGNAERSAEDFAYLHAYSPLHNIKKGAVYPATLVMTADHDDRVVSSHAKKFVAALQTAGGGKNPILLRVDTKAGHGGGKPMSKMIEERSDMLSFLFAIFGMRLKAGNVSPVTYQGK